MIDDLNIDWTIAALEQRVIIALTFHCFDRCFIDSLVEPMSL